MTQNISYHNLEYHGRPEVLSYLSSLKSKNPNLTVIDVGAAMNPLSSAFLTHTLDMNPVSLPNVTSFSGSINDYETWQVLFDYVEKHGKFDFCNCTHVLEDLAYPMAALKYMPRIAKEGFIAVPSMFYELQRRQQMRGDIHHRWMFTNKDNSKLFLYPKVSIIDYINYNEDYINQNAKLELRMFWKDTIEFEIINDDFLGPSYEAVVNMYLLK